ncbi:MAG: PSD1 and planctomycete cytochrome C domain-containing protein [Acidobacteriota bacterium]
MNGVWSSISAIFLLMLVGILGSPIAIEASQSENPLNPSKLPEPAGGKVDFQQQIKPIFQAKCYACHGGDQQMGGLQLDDREAALAGGYSGKVILPGRSAESRLIHLVAGLDEKIIMPMSGERLSREEIALLRAWIDQGASWPEAVTPATEAAQVSTEKMRQGRNLHWSFIPPERARIPRVKNLDWGRNPIDAFILARLEEESISPSPEAGKRTLIRRLSLDLTGLPPSMQEVEAFLMDNRADAYERMVDRLLASPHFGEKWAIHWLDLARYADSDGYEKDLPRPYAWRYRDWVIDALNRNMPFDQFTIEQIAGDLLPGATIEQKIATGFHRNTLTNREGGVDLEEFRVERVIDRTSTVGTTWLGLTLECARCHDHKFDPISQKEFYQMTAFSNRAVEVNLDAPLAGEMGLYLRRRPEYERKRDELLAQYNVVEMVPDWVDDLRQAARNPGERVNWDVAWDTVGKMLDHGHQIVRMDESKRTVEQQEDLVDHFVEWSWTAYGRKRWEELGFKELHEKLDELHDEYPPLTEAPTIARNPDPPQTHILVRGDYRQPGIQVEPGVLSILHPLPAHEPPATRLTLTRWLVSKDNPLTARVTVNRFWQEIFERGLVLTSEDFGTRSEKPSHPELLDWLATEFQKDWHIKRIIRLIVTSATYRQKSDAREDLISRDPENRLLARAPRLQLKAELIRDSALAVSGLLNPKVGGRSVRPPLPEGVVELTFGGGGEWEEDKDQNAFRRGLYIHFQRTIPYPQLQTFNAPDRLRSCTRRERSTTPLQALVLLNDPVFFEAARALAVRVIQEGPEDLEERIEYAFQLCLARKPTPEERDRLLRFYETQKQILEEESDSATEIFPASGVPGTEPQEAAVWVGLSRVLLNLDEFITKE